MGEGGPAVVLERAEQGIGVFKIAGAAQLATSITCNVISFRNWANEHKAVTITSGWVILQNRVLERDRSPGLENAASAEAKATGYVVRYGAVRDRPHAFVGFDTAARKDAIIAADGAVDDLDRAIGFNDTSSSGVAGGIAADGAVGDHYCAGQT